MENNEQEYVIMDKSGMVVEKSNNFNTGISGYLTDIIQKSRSVLKSEDTINSVEIFYDNSLLLIKDNCSANLSMTYLVKDKNK